MNKPARFLSIALGLVLAIASRADPSAEPKNLSLLKEEIVSYIDSGRYLEGIALVTREAQTWIEQRAKQGGGQLAVVFDIDETMLSNLPQMRAADFGYQASAWTEWVARGEAPVIEPVREVYRTARRLGIKVIYLTGRKERDRPGTEKNLRIAGVDDYAVLLFKPDASTETYEQFKTAARKRLVEEGWVIVANIGDQQSDLAGGYAERTFKLPSPFYLTSLTDRPADAAEPA